MALPVLDVTGRDFEALVPLLRDRMITRFPDLPQTDFNFSNFSSVFIDLFAGVGDGANFYIDNTAQNLFWDSVRDRDFAIKLGVLIGFVLKAATAAKVTLRFTLLKVALGDVVIPIRTQVKTNSPDNPVIFETITEVTIIAGQLFIDVEAENAELISEDFTSNGQPGQLFTVERSPFVQGSSVVIGGGAVGEWTAVPDFFNSKTVNEDYIPLVDSEDRLTIEFGDGEQGKIPVGDITLDYKIGGGTRGNVFSNTIKVLESTFTDQFSTLVNITVTNPLEPSIPGEDRESVAQARFRAPRSVKTNERTVAEEDFEINALEVQGVSRARIFTSNDDALISENTGFLRIVQTGGGASSQALKDSIFDFLTIDKPLTVGFVLNVVDADFVSIDFVMKVFVNDESFKAVVHGELIEAFTEFFSETILTGEDAGQPNFEMDFGKKFFNSPVECLAQEASEQIRNVELTTDLAVVYNLLTSDFPIKGTLIFEDGDTALPLPPPPA
ncbi:MAG: baseplate J/gp47 family protein [Nitrosomonadaceae bacterium]